MHKQILYDYLHCLLHEERVLRNKLSQSNKSVNSSLLHDYHTIKMQTSLSASDHSLIRKRIYLLASFFDMFLDLSSSIFKFLFLDQVARKLNIDSQREPTKTGILEFWQSLPEKRNKFASNI